LEPKLQKWRLVERKKDFQEKIALLEVKEIVPKAVI